MVLQKEVGEMWKTELLLETTTRSLKLRVKLRSKKGGILAFLVKAPNVTADKGNERQNRNEEAVVVLGVGRLTSFKKHH